MRRGPQEPPPRWLIILVGVGLIAAGITIGYPYILVVEGVLAWERCGILHLNFSENPCHARH